MNGMDLLEMKDSSELNCLESTPEKNMEITAKGTNTVGRFVTGQREKNANAAKGNHSSFKHFASRWTLMRSLAVVTTVVSWKQKRWGQPQPVETPLLCHSLRDGADGRGSTQQ